MLAKRLIALIAALVIGCSITPANAQSHSRAEIEVLAQYYAQYYGVPLELVRRVINRESTFNPSARNGPYYGLMQILPATARTMGFQGQASDLLNAETNMIYAVKYLRGAWLLANGSHDRAVQLYAADYYYHARDAGLLEETGLRPGPASPVAPTPPTASPTIVAQAEPAVAPPPIPAVTETPAAVDPIEVAAIETAAIAPLGFLPPARPMGLEATQELTAEPNPALNAIAAAEAPPVLPARPAFAAEAEPEIAEADAADPESADVEIAALDDEADAAETTADIVAIAAADEDPAIETETAQVAAAPEADATETDTAAIAIAAATADEGAETDPVQLAAYAADDAEPQTDEIVEVADADEEAVVEALRPSIDLVASTFALLDTVQTVRR